MKKNGMSPKQPTTTFDWLLFHSSMTRIKVTARVVWKKRPLPDSPTQQAEMKRRKWEVEKLEEEGRSPESSVIQQLAQVTVEAGPSAESAVEPAKKIRLTVAGEAPCKGFLKKSLMKRSQKCQAGMVALCEIFWYLMSTKLLIHKHAFARLVLYKVLLVYLNIQQSVLTLKS